MTTTIRHDNLTITNVDSVRPGNTSVVEACRATRESDGVIVEYFYRDKEGYGCWAYKSKDIYIGFLSIFGSFDKNGPPNAPLEMLVLSLKNAFNYAAVDESTRPLSEKDAERVAADILSMAKHMPVVYPWRGEAALNNIKIQSPS